MAQRLSRRALADYIAEQWSAGVDRAKLIRQLAAYLVENRRTNEAILIVRDIEAALAEKGQLLAKVSSARELSSQVKDELVMQLKASQHAKSVELNTEVDANLLGGMKVELPGKEFDGTLRQRLQALKLQTFENNI